MRWVLCLVLFLFALPARAETAWCAPEVETLPGEVCHFTADPSGNSLVIFLHGVIQPDTTWQWTQERAMVRHARAHHFSVIMPRGRRGIGPKSLRDWWAWPTGTQAQQEVEAEVIDEWMAAKALLEQRNGHPFARVYVFGFSNGAYYASSLALRDRVPATGYAVFAGGSGGYLRRQAQHVTHRAPIYVGYGTADREATRDCRGLGTLLQSLKWPHRINGKRRVGHTIADSQVREAMAFLDPEE
jgi:predicted esterase